mmetsp:Transcript_3307/g.4420  ORF Transcript_3307/g.4420 Transcript_3307/m.4420 type:complete len:588 (+) Transcript_3307:135-1898(+)
MTELEHKVDAISGDELEDRRENEKGVQEVGTKDISEKDVIQLTKDKVESRDTVQEDSEGSSYEESSTTKEREQGYEKDIAASHEGKTAEPKDDVVDRQVNDDENTESEPASQAVKLSKDTNENKDILTTKEKEVGKTAVPDEDSEGNEEKSLEQETQSKNHGPQPSTETDAVEQSPTGCLNDADVEDKESMISQSTEDKITKEDKTAEDGGGVSISDRPDSLKSAATANKKEGSKISRMKQNYFQNDAKPPLPARPSKGRTVVDARQQYFGKDAVKSNSKHTPFWSGSGSRPAGANIDARQMYLRHGSSSSHEPSFWNTSGRHGKTANKDKSGNEGKRKFPSHQSSGTPLDTTSSGRAMVNPLLMSELSVRLGIKPKKAPVEVLETDGAVENIKENQSDLSDGEKDCDSKKDSCTENAGSKKTESKQEMSTDKSNTPVAEEKIETCPEVNEAVKEMETSEVEEVSQDGDENYDAESEKSDLSADERSETADQDVSVIVEVDQEPPPEDSEVQAESEIQQKTLVAETSENKNGDDESGKLELAEKVAVSEDIREPTRISKEKPEQSNNEPKRKLSRWQRLFLCCSSGN